MSCRPPSRMWPSLNRQSTGVRRKLWVRDPPATTHRLESGAGGAKGQARDLRQIGSITAKIREDATFVAATPDRRTDLWSLPWRRSVMAAVTVGPTAPTCRPLERGHWPTVRTRTGGQRHGSAEPTGDIRSLTVSGRSHVKRRTRVAGTRSPALMALSSATSVTTRLAVASAASLMG
jgi:hypothetical protein